MGGPLLPIHKREDRFSQRSSAGQHFTAVLNKRAHTLSFPKRTNFHSGNPYEVLTRVCNMLRSVPRNDRLAEKMRKQTLTCRCSPQGFEREHMAVSFLQCGFLAHICITNVLPVKWWSSQLFIFKTMPCLLIER